MTTQKRIWALLDERQGNTSQTLGVAEALGLPFETRRVVFTPLIRMPNIFIRGSMLGMSRASELTPPWPDVVISTARRLGLAASYIKAENHSSFLAQIQWPGWPASHFDLIAAPLHDGLHAGGNVMTALAAPHRGTPQVIARETQRWAPKLTDYPAPRVALLVGGSARGWTFTAAHARELAGLASHLTNAMKGSLLVTTSRRTGPDIQQTLDSALTCPHYFHHWQYDGAPEDNPYFAFLGLADVIIATGDSVSMCSEACATGKPVYIYAAPGFVPAKQRTFVGELFTRNFARPLNESEIARGLFKPAPWVDATTAIAAEICKRAGL